MKLSELSLQYEKSAVACRQRISALQRQFERERLSENEKIALLRRIYILDDMARDASATAAYLKNYYGDDENDGNKQRAGISGAAQLSEARLGQKHDKYGGAGALCHRGRAYTAAAANGGNVLSAANDHGGYCR